MVAAGSLKPGLNLRQGAKSNYQCSIAPFIAHLHAAVRGDAVPTGFQALQFHLCARCQGVERVKGVAEGHAANFSAERLTVGGAAFKGAVTTAPAEKPQQKVTFLGFCNVAAGPAMHSQSRY